MGMTCVGTVKTGGVYDVNGKDGSKKQMISFTVVDSMGNHFPCQMWPDDPQFGQLAPVIGGLRRQRVQLSVAGYTVRMRKFPDGKEAPQVNIIVSDVGQPDPAQADLLAMQFTGTVKTGGVYEVNGKDGSKKQMISFNAVDELGTAFPCQMWPDDPQFADLAQLIGNVRRKPVQFVVASYSLRMRKLPDGKETPQINFVVSDVAFPALAGK